MSGGRWSLTRADDERVLSILHVLETEGSAAAKARFGVNKNQLAGMRDRFLRQPARIACACTRPENRDGGMGPLWWRS